MQRPEDREAQEYKYPKRTGKEVTEDYGSGRRASNPLVKSEESTVGDTKKDSFSDKILNNPALVGTLASALVIFLVSVLGFDAVQAQNSVDLILYFLVTLGVGGASGIAVRQSVSPLKRFDKKK